MLSALLDGEMHAELGAGRTGFTVRAGEGLVIEAGTPFRYRLGVGSRLLVLDLPVEPSGELGLTPLTAPPRLARALARLGEAPTERALRAVRESARTVARAPVGIGPHAALARVLDVKATFDREFASPPRIAALAVRHRVSSDYLSRAFLRVVGVSPQAYLQHLRHEHFLRRLLERPGALEPLAHEAGFGDYPSFSRLARKRYGVPPSALLEGRIRPSRDATAG